MKNSILKRASSAFLSTSVFAALALASVACDRKTLDDSVGEPQNQSGDDSQSLVGYSTADVAKHAVTSDCWIIINDGVYNVTAFLAEHPGGTRAIARLCGQDATAAFEGVGHSSTAQTLREKYLIGKIATGSNLRSPGANAGRTSTGEPQTQPVPVGGPSAEPPAAPAPVPPSPSAPVPLPVYTWAQIQQHAVQADCWIVIEQKVYDITKLFVEHPGGRAPVRYCGKDATNAFSFHSDDAREFAKKFLIGTLAP
jgi:cytochrome b involved in lipid metabolism